MARPSKQGLDYFPFDVDLLDDEKLDFLRERYGAIINDVYIALLCLLYKGEGYYIPYDTEAKKQDCAWFIFKKTRGGKYPIKLEAIPEMIEACVARGLFSGDHYPEIITSERAQATFYSCTVERKSVEINPEYWIVDDETMGKLSKKHSYYLSLHSESKSDEKRDYSDEKPSKLDEKSLNKSKDKVNITTNNNRACAREEIENPSLRDFLIEFPNVVIDTPCVTGIDYEFLREKFLQSRHYLSDPENPVSLKWVVSNYQLIIRDKYRDKGKSRSGGKADTGKAEESKDEAERERLWKERYGENAGT